MDIMKAAVVTPMAGILVSVFRIFGFLGKLVCSRALNGANASLVPPLA